jgi:nitrite reductase/ring-hydroxylating ferredoxin subunit
VSHTSGQSRRTKLYVVADAAAFPPGTRRIVDLGGRSIGVFNVDGRYFAIRNRCPHQGGPLCRGRTGPLSTPRFADDARPEIHVERPGQILKCPWHGWEFDLATGKAVFGEGVRVAVYRAYAVENGEQSAALCVPPAVETYPTRVEGGRVVVELQS